MTAKGSRSVAWVAGKQLHLLRVGVLPLGGKPKRKKSGAGGGAVAAPQPKLLSHRRKMTSVAFHPSEYIVAVGDQDGVILLWYCPAASSWPTRLIYLVCLLGA